MYDEDLSAYMAEFSGVGAAPTSLSGYGFGQRRHSIELSGLGAAASAPTSTALSLGMLEPSKALPPQPTTAGGVTAATVSATVLQNYLNALDVGITKSGSYDAETEAGWNKYASVFREPHSKVAPRLVDGVADRKNVWISQQALTRLKERADKTGKLRAEASRPIGSKPTSTPTTRPSTGTTTAAKNMDANTLDVQGILLRLGWKSTGTALTDGKYGPTTAGNWAQSANKRGLSPYMAKKTADGKTVTVREKTYLELKAVADALVPPGPTPGPAPEPMGGSLLSLPPDQTSTISVLRLNEVLARLSQQPAGSTAPWPTLVEMFQSGAKKANLDPRIEQVPPDKAIVLRKTWDQFEKEAGAIAPPQPPPGPERSEAERDVEVILKASTASVPVNTLRTAINAAIQNGALKMTPVKKGSWEGLLRAPLLVLMDVSKDSKGYAVWEMALVKGKLVSKDGTSVKLPPDRAADIKKLAATFEKAVAEEKGRYVGYTAVNPATVIEQINALGVTTKKFDKSGGSKELADALATFFEETKTPKPSGDHVRIDAKGIVYIKDEAIKALASTAMSIKARADTTKAYRDSMVKNALQISNAEISVVQFQEALQEAVLSGWTKGANKALYSKVKVTGAFDKETRAAYTEIARTLTIGPAVQEYQRLLVSQQQAMTTAQVNAAVLEVQKQVWSDFLNQAVVKKGGTLSIMTLPAIATSVIAASDRYRKTVSQDKKHDDIVAAQNKALADAVAKSTAIMSILDVQQGLSHMAEAGKIKKTGVKVTGRADKATNGFPTGGLFGVASYIFQDGYVVPETVWSRYLKAVGILVVSATQVKASWNEANYIALPPSLADVLSKAASQWILKYGEPAAGVNLAPLPLDNQELRLRFRTPSVVTVQRLKPGEIKVEDKPSEPKKPAKPTKSKDDVAKAKKAADAAAAKLRAAKKRAADAEKRAKDAEELARQQQTDFSKKEAERLKHEAAQAAQQVQQATQETAAANTTLNLTINAAGGSGGSGGSTTASGGEIAPAPGPGPEPAPPPEEPIAPAPSGGGGGGILLGLLALVGVGVALSKSKKGDENPETAYAGQ